LRREAIDAAGEGYLDFFNGINALHTDAAKQRRAGELSRYGAKESLASLAE
jgi:hypothetical protein